VTVRGERGFGDVSLSAVAALTATIMFARALLTLTLIVNAACSGQSALDTSDQARAARETRVTGPKGLEQRLTAVVDPEDFREPGFHTLLVTSDVFNTGSAPVPVTARVCLFFASDVHLTAEADLFEPLVTCGAVQQTSELVPGASVGPMQLRYRLRSGSGMYTIRVRHALDPEFRAETSFQIP
jgi:hypothetical protein